MGTVDRLGAALSNPRAGPLCLPLSTDVNYNSMLHPPACRGQGMMPGARDREAQSSSSRRRGLNLLAPVFCGSRFCLLACVRACVPLKFSAEGEVRSMCVSCTSLILFARIGSNWLEFPPFCCSLKTERRLNERRPAATEANSKRVGFTLICRAAVCSARFRSAAGIAVAQAGQHRSSDTISTRKYTAHVEQEKSRLSSAVVHCSSFIALTFS